MLTYVPFAAIVSILIATLLRGRSIKRTTGDRAWAFSSARGVQRLAGLAFAATVVALAVAGALADRQAGLAISLPAAALSVLGAIIVIVAQIQMGRAWRVGVREGDAPVFVRHGLFRFSRNPIFVGMILIGLGAALVSGTWWAWVALGCFIVACSVQVSIEEAHLEARFGEAYLVFRRAVPRWIGAGSGQNGAP
jgi:protein-S-isoprenylcysteine O-methyltransferase Ste14